jgi:hypothetical protein
LLCLYLFRCEPFTIYSIWDNLALRNSPGTVSDDLRSGFALMKKWKVRSYQFEVHISQTHLWTCSSFRWFRTTLEQ